MNHKVYSGIMYAEDIGALDLKGVACNMVKCDLCGRSSKYPLFGQLCACGGVYHAISPIPSEVNSDG